MRTEKRSVAGPGAAALLLAAACVFTAVGARAGEASAPDPAGLEVFNANCVACHADGGNAIEPKKPLRGSAKLADFETFLGWVRSPVAPMPPFTPQQVPDERARQLYRYLVATFGAAKAN